MPYKGWGISTVIFVAYIKFGDRSVFISNEDGCIMSENIFCISFLLLFINYMFSVANYLL